MTNNTTILIDPSEVRAARGALAAAKDVDRAAYHVLCAATENREDKERVLSNKIGDLTRSAMGLGPVGEQVSHNAIAHAKDRAEHVVAEASQAT